MGAELDAHLRKLSGQIQRSGGGSESRAQDKLADGCGQLFLQQSARKIRRIRQGAVRHKAFRQGKRGIGQPVFQSIFLDGRVLEGLYGGSIRENAPFAAQGGAEGVCYGEAFPGHPREDAAVEVGRSAAQLQVFGRFHQQGFPEFSLLEEGDVRQFPGLEAAEPFFGRQGPAGLGLEVFVILGQVPVAIFLLAAGGEVGVYIGHRDGQCPGGIIRYGFGEFRHRGRCSPESAEKAGGSLSGKGHALQADFVRLAFLDGPGAPGGEVLDELALAVFFSGEGLQQLGGVGVGHQHHGLAGDVGHQILQAAGAQDGQALFQVAGPGVHKGFRSGGQQESFFLQGFEAGFGGQLLGKGV